MFKDNPSIGVADEARLTTLSTRAEVEQRLSPLPFLDQLEKELDQVLNVIGETSNRLGTAGFYVPPSAAPADPTPTALEPENTVRTRIVRVVERLQQRAQEIAHQVERAC
jgi:hypothetical protein